jgi:hypothetical protein
LSQLSSAELLLMSNQSGTPSGASTLAQPHVPLQHRPTTLSAPPNHTGMTNPALGIALQNMHASLSLPQLSRLLTNARSLLIKIAATTFQTNASGLTLPQLSNQ